MQTVKMRKNKRAVFTLCVGSFCFYEIEFCIVI